MNFDVKFGMEYRGGESVQADWSQNDPAAKDYVRNRPGGYDVVTPVKEITWDGNPEGRTVVTDGNTVLALVSDDVFTLEQLAGAEVAVTTDGVEQSQTIPEDDPGSLFAELADGILGNEIMLIVSTPGATLDSFAFPASGVYFRWIDDKGTIIYASKLAVKEKIEVAKIPAKYLDATSAYILDLDYDNGEAYLKGFDWDEFVAAVHSPDTIIMLRENAGSAESVTCAPCVPVWNRNAYDIYCGNAYLSISRKGTLSCNFDCFERSGAKEAIIMYSKPSYKKFKITVDDSGTLSATEVTT